MIRLSGLTKIFGNRVAVNNISFEVKKGEVLGFLGPNGAGKTTTMRMIVGFLLPDAGEIFIGNWNVSKDPIKTKSLIGYLPESPPLYNELTVDEYLVFTLKLSGVHKSHRKSKLDDVYTKCGIGDVRKRLIGNLSKGYRQRVGIAQAIIHNPEYLILDEPTSGLDPKQIHEIRELIRSFSKDHTIIFSSHILPEVSKTCDRVVIINEGNIVASDTLFALSSKISEEGRYEIIVSRPDEKILKILESIEGVSSVHHNQAGKQFVIQARKDNSIMENIAKVALENNWGIEGLHPIELSPEEVFLRLTEVEK